jgi:hypothetical protein
MVLGPPEDAQVRVKGTVAVHSRADFRKYLRSVPTGVKFVDQVTRITYQ